jgi:hypothetical protein
VVDRVARIAAKPEGMFAIKQQEGLHDFSRSPFISSEVMKRGQGTTTSSQMVQMVPTIAPP